MSDSDLKEIKRYARLAMAKGLCLHLLEAISAINDPGLVARLTRMFVRAKKQIRKDWPPFSIGSEILAVYVDKILNDLENGDE